MEQAFASGPFDVFYADANTAAQLEQQLQQVLPSYLRAVVTTTGTSGRVVQILGATDIIPLDGASLIQTGPNAYSRNVLTLDIKSGLELRNGEQLRNYRRRSNRNDHFRSKRHCFPADWKHHHLL